MPRYFLEVGYMGTGYSGFQVQENAPTIQGEIENAIRVFQKEAVVLTGSSRTDTGVHALQNYFHFDLASDLNPAFLYKLNAILPAGIAAKRILPVKPDSHARFGAVSRSYRYVVSRVKDPFEQDRSWYFPYRLDMDLLAQAANLLKNYEDFTSFSKRNTQVKTFTCSIRESRWLEEGSRLVYEVRANRFLRGMVRGLVATMLRVGRGKIDLDQFTSIIEAKDCTKASFAAPGQGLFLVEVEYPEGYLEP